MGTGPSKNSSAASDPTVTSLGDGSRIAKDAPRMEVIGEIDLLNSQIGFAISIPGGDHLNPTLRELQHDLLDLGRQLALPGRPLLSEAHAARIESEILKFNDDLPELQGFILPGGSQKAAVLHLSRATTREAERRLVGLLDAEGALDSNDGQSLQEGMRYLNRLSDLLFLMSRAANVAAEIPEPLLEKGFSTTEI